MYTISETELIVSIVSIIIFLMIAIVAVAKLARYQGELEGMAKLEEAEQEQKKKPASAGLRDKKGNWTV